MMEELQPLWDLSSRLLAESELSGMNEGYAGGLSAAAERVQLLLPRLEAEIAALKEPMACGHPKACWYEPSTTPICTATAEYLHAHPEWQMAHCTACEHERLAVAAARDRALEEAADECDRWNDAHHAAREIRALKSGGSK